MYNDNENDISGLGKFFSSIPENRKAKTGEEKVEEALTKALDNTTPSKAGTPWPESEDNFELEEAELKQNLLDRLLGN